MATFSISAPWWNFRSPKCRNCTWYKWKGHWYSGKCTCEESKADKYRKHNSKACSQFNFNHHDGYVITDKDVEPGDLVSIKEPDNG